MTQPIIKEFVHPNHVINLFGFDDYDPALREQLTECFKAALASAVNKLDPEHQLDNIYIGADICNTRELNPEILF